MARGLLARIGNTPLVELERIPPPGSARVLVKCENLNPSGSSKDRSAVSMIESAERDGRLRPGQRIVEMSGGGTGTALAMISAIKGYDCTIVCSDAFADEKLRAIAAFGADLNIIHGVHGKATYPELFDEMIARVQQLAAEPGTFYTDQMRNPANPRGFMHLGREIWAQTEGRVDGFVMACGSGGCFSGSTAELKQHNPDLLAVVPEPADYRHVSGGPTGVHRIDGIGDGEPGPLFRRDLVDGIEAVTNEEAYDMARRRERRGRTARRGAPRAWQDRRDGHLRQRLQVPLRRPVRRRHPARQRAASAGSGLSSSGGRRGGVVIAAISR
jgi:cysteine synthase